MHAADAFAEARDVLQAASVKQRVVAFLARAAERMDIVVHHTRIEKAIEFVAQRTGVPEALLLVLLHVLWNRPSTFSPEEMLCGGSGDIEMMDLSDPNAVAYRVNYERTPPWRVPLSVDFREARRLAMLEGALQGLSMPNGQTVSMDERFMLHVFALLVAAQKAYDDECFETHEWCRLLCINPRLLGEMESRSLAFLDYRVMVTEKQFRDGWAAVQRLDGVT